MTMFIPDKEEFMREVNRIENADVRKTMDDLYNHLLGKKKIENVASVIYGVLAELFPKNMYFKEVFIPLDFHKTIMGRVLFSILYGIEEFSYTINDIIEFSKTERNQKGYSKQYLKQEIDHGRLKGEKKDGVWRFTQSQVADFLGAKNIKFHK